MSRSRTVALIGLLLAAFAALAATAPAAAHTVTPPVTTPVAPTPDILAAPPPAPDEIRGPESAAVPAWIVAGVLLLAVTVARRRPRRAVVLALVLLLTIFAFENALHSVHHGFDAKQYDECSIAAAAAHLSAVSVDGIFETSVVLAVAGRTAEPDLSLRSTRLLGPDQGRAPPVPTA
jgi:disulfide bond formation protein DsbB